MGYRVKYRCIMVDPDDRVPTIGSDKYGLFAVNQFLWGTQDELYLTGFGKPNHPVPALPGQLNFSFCFNHGWFHAHFGERYADNQ